MNARAYLDGYFSKEALSVDEGPLKGKSFRGHGIWQLLNPDISTARMTANYEALGAPKGFDFKYPFVVDASKSLSGGLIGGGLGYGAGKLFSDHDDDPYIGAALGGALGAALSLVMSRKQRMGKHDAMIKKYAPGISKEDLKANVGNALKRHAKQSKVRRALTGALTGFYNQGHVGQLKHLVGQGGDTPVRGKHLATVGAASAVKPFAFGPSMAIMPAMGIHSNLGSIDEAREALDKLKG